MFGQRITTVLAAAFVAASAVNSATAQTWNNYTGVGTGWNVAANWDPMAVPVFDPTTALTFGSTPSNLPPTFAFQPTGNYTSTATGATTYILNSMTFNGTGACDVASNGIVITTDNAAGTISFQGTNPMITQSGTGSVAFANGTATTDLTMNAAPGATGLTINGTGSGHVNINGVIGGTGNLVVDHTGASPMDSGAQIFIVPGGPNTYAGNLVLNNGNLTFNTATAANVPIAAGNSLVINGGTLRGSGTFVLPNAVTLNSQMKFVGVVAPTFNGIISGNGGIFHNPSASILATFNNTISGTGSIAAEGTGLSLAQIAFAGAAGAATNATSYTINFGALTATNATATVTRLNSNAALTLNSSAFLLTAGAGGPMNEAVASTTLSGHNLLLLTPTTTQPVTFNGGILTRNQNGTFLAQTTGTGLTLGGTVGAAGNATLLFPNLSAGDNINGVLPFGSAFIQDGATTAGTLVRYNGTNGVVPLNRTTDYTLNTNLAPISLISQPTTNYRVVAGTTAIPGNSYGAFSNNIGANALLLEAPSGSGLLGGSIYGTGTLTLTSGTLATSLVGGTVQPTFLGMTVTKNVALGGTQGQFHTQEFATALGNISGTAGLVKSGGGQLWLLGDNSGLSGPTGSLSINGAAVIFSRDANLGAPGERITMGSGWTTALGTATSQLQFNANTHFEDGTASSITITRPLTLANRGAGILAANQQTGVMNYDGVISGSGRLNKSFIGLVNLGGMNTYTGDTVILQGSVGVSSNANLGDLSSNIVLSSTSGTPAFQALLQANSSFSSARNILITSTTAVANGISTNGASTTLTWDGHIGGNQTGVPFVKVGAGTLELTANNTFNGAFTQGDAAGSATRRPGYMFAQPAGTVTLSGANGAMSAATSYTLNAGATLNLDSSGAVNQNRLASKQVTMNGANLTMTGNASANVFEHIGVSNTAGLTNGTLGNTITLTQPTSMSGQSTTLVATSYNTSTATGITFFRGDNLGGATGDRTSMIFVTAPTLINNVLPQSFYANSATANPQDFATITANAVQPFTGYVALPASGSVTTTTYSHTGAIVLTGATAGNALKLTNGAIDMGANNIVLGSATQTGMLLSTGVDSITTGAVGTIDVAFGTQAARISVNDALNIGSVANPVRVTSSGGLHKFGPGTLELSSANVTAGGYQVSGGTLRLLTAAAFTNGQTTTMLPGTTLDLNNNGTIAAPINTALAGYGTVNIGSGTLGTGATSQNFGGSLAGTANSTLINTGTSTQLLAGNSPNFSGNVQILAGGMTIDTDVVPTDVVNPGALGTGTSPIQLGAVGGANSATLTITGNVKTFNRDITVPLNTATTVTLTTVQTQVTNMASNINLSRELRLNGAFSSTAHIGGAATITGNITQSGGTGSLDWFGGNYNLWGNNSYSGRTFINAGLGNTLGVGSDTAFGSGLIQVAASTLFTGNLRADQGNRTLANPWQFDTGATILGFGGKNDLTFSGPVNLNNGTRTLNVYSTGITTFRGNMTEAGGVASIVKNGGGRLDLSGANVYTGGTTINGGRLHVNNTMGFGTGTGAVTVNASGTLGGTGTIGGALTVNTAGILSPGNSVGTLSVGNNSLATLSNGSIYDWEINGYAPTPAPFNSGLSTDLTQHDHLAVLGNGTFVGGNFTFKITELGSPIFTDGATYSWTVVSASMTPTIGTVAIDISQAPTFAPFASLMTLTMNTNTGQVNLNLTVPVPEPTTVLGICAAGAGAVGLIRRRFKKTTVAA